jgi:hypothetical protein
MADRDPVRQSVQERPLYSGAFLASFWNCEAFWAFGFTLDDMVEHHEWFASKESFIKFLGLARDAVLQSMDEPVLTLELWAEGKRYGDRAGLVNRRPKCWGAHEGIRTLLAGSFRLNQDEVEAASTMHDQLMLLCTLPGWKETYPSGKLNESLVERLQCALELIYYQVDAAKVRLCHSSN